MRVPERVQLTLASVQRQRSAIAVSFMHSDTCSVANISSYLGLYPCDWLERVQRVHVGGVL